jgi:hypothetical protein
VADKALTLDLTLNVVEKVLHRVRKYKFAEGYEQIQKDGINTKITEYEITTKPLSSAAATTFIADLDSVAQGDFFVATLKPFSNVAKKYRLKTNNYQRSYLPSTARSIFTFTLIEAFAP